MDTAPTTPPRIVFLDRATIDPKVDLTRPHVPHCWQEHDRTAPDQVVARLRGAQVAITNKVPITRATLDALPDLRFVTIAATGYDIVDLDACREKGVTVSNVRGYAVGSVPEHTMALILALARGVVGYRRDVIAGDWQASGQFCFFNHDIRDLSGATLGLIGAGSIGASVARLAEAFGMRVLQAERKGAATLRPGKTAFDDVLARADVLTVHCPLTSETKGMIGDAEFAAMARRPIVINVSRGGIVEEAAAVRAIEAGRISGLGLDVLTTEPPAGDNPILRICARPDVILTPHVAWASHNAMTALWDQVVASIDGFLAGAPVRVLVGP
ncbi:D-2-hydroxyacid dehydrogenase [Falsirhodobacter halotolerans]|uniref:D-2-hydroxyacid dehydrogenase n=1 Tax=Falsirhodobacter halotolerans TaxID=1146892 RepID=UPI001FD33FF6|nr:D-2-hydroxyacid dehydrogenase [Falsirhodobacter halotolerans]MCJ8139864.1 D-2-hydroxyacid dehydrogenase [Falsirhodobacter halotolerans]